MTDNRTTELVSRREATTLLEEFLCDYQKILLSHGISTSEAVYRQNKLINEYAERIEQTIAATLGSGTCENLGKRYSGTWFICSKCGAESPNGTYSERWMHQDHTDEECAEYNGEPFNYCPNCGKRVSA